MAEQCIFQDKKTPCVADFIFMLIFLNLHIIEAVRLDVTRWLVTAGTRVQSQTISYEIHSMKIKGAIHMLADRFILWYVDPLLDNDREISKITTAVTE
jgi:hypothetical protein